MFFKILTFLPFSYTESSDIQCFTLQVLKINDNNDSESENDNCGHFCVYRSFIQRILENTSMYNIEEHSSSSSEIENQFKLEMLEDFYPGIQDSESLIGYEESSEANKNPLILNQPLDESNNFENELVDSEVTKDTNNNSELPLNSVTYTEQEDLNMNTDHLIINDSITSESIINQNPTVLLQDDTITSTFVSVLESLIATKTQTLFIPITSLFEFVNISISTNIATVSTSVSNDL